MPPGACTTTSLFHYKHPSHSTYRAPPQTSPKYTLFALPILSFANHRLTSCRRAPPLPRHAQCCPYHPIPNPHRFKLGNSSPLSSHRCHSTPKLDNTRHLFTTAARSAALAAHSRHRSTPGHFFLTHHCSLMAVGAQTRPSAPLLSRERTTRYFCYVQTAF